MRWLRALLLFIPAGLLAWDGSAAELANQVRRSGLDQEECYRVRDLNFSKEDIRFYLTEGYLIFGKPVDGRRRSAVFVADEEAGDAEILLFAPSRSERLSLARGTGAPNLDEHFQQAVMIFTDDTYEALAKQIREAGEPKKSPERGVLLEEAWTEVVRNLAASFETRLVHDALSGAGPASGFFYAAVSGERLGNFDVYYDPLAPQQITLGRVAASGSSSNFDTWTSFEAHSFRNHTRSLPDTGYKLSNYRLQATLQPDLNLKVITKVTLVPMRTGIRVLSFHLSPSMRLTSASVDGVPAESFQREAMRENLIRGSDAIFLLLPGVPLESGRPYELEFQNEGRVVQAAGNGVYFVRSRDNWYPKLPMQFARYDVLFYYPKNLDLVVAGELVEQGAADDYNFTHRRLTNPVCFLGFNLGEYQHVRLSRGRYEIEVYANKRFEPAIQTKSRLPVVIPAQPVYDPLRRRTVYLPGPITPTPEPSDRLQELAAEMAGAFDFMTARFGPPPVRNLTVSPIPGGFGQGFPGMVYLSTLLYLRPEERPISRGNPFQQTFYSEILHAHEVAHQWWGNVVAPASHQDAWLMEALANYSALLYLEKRKGVKALDSVLAEYSQRLRAPANEGRTVESTGPIAWGMRLISSQAPDAWRAITYEKGSWIMHMLRRRMGDQRFWAMLSELIQRYRHNTLTTEQFRALAAKFQPPGSNDPKLDTFFENWVYSTGIPTLRIEYTVRGKAPAFKLDGKLTQSDVDADFTTWVPIEMQFRTGKPQVQWVRTDSEPVSFTASLRQAPLRVLLDPSASVLAVRK